MAWGQPAEEVDHPAMRVSMLETGGPTYEVRGAGCLVRATCSNHVCGCSNGPAADTHLFELMQVLHSCVRRILLRTSQVVIPESSHVN